MQEREGEKFAVIGLGYVGLPVAIAFAGIFPGTIGFDISKTKVEALKAGIDPAGEVDPSELTQNQLVITSDPADLCDTTFFVVAVPTPIDDNHQPDLAPLRSASELVGRALRPGAVVVFESTVYPGVTEDVCGPILERVSGLRRGIDFKLGYSPERINPGDKEHTLPRITKVVSGEDAGTLERVANAYSAIIPAGIHRASSIKVAEAAKVIENTQRDLNIALMNELAVIFDRMSIPTRDVLAAAGTKWNFLRFTPGLVGGHCIGVDPYYLTAKAEQLGYHPQVILAGRRINDGMGEFIARRLLKLLIHANVAVKGARVGILGMTFKENVSDIRNSRVTDIVRELQDFGIQPILHDPHADPAEFKHEYRLSLSDWEEFRDLDAVVIAVAHDYYLQMGIERLLGGLKTGGVLMDIKAALSPDQVPHHVEYWCL